MDLVLGNSHLAPHFLNSIQHFEGRYFCFVDCFLEVWMSIVGRLPSLSRGGDEFTDRLAQVIRRYDAVISRPFLTL